MSYTDIILTCLTMIELLNLVIRVIKSTPESTPELTDEMRKRLYS